MWLVHRGSTLKDLEGDAGEPKTLELAQRLSQKLSDLDSEFRTHHHARIDLFVFDAEETLAKEQETWTAELSVRVKQVIAASNLHAGLH